MELETVELKHKWQLGPEMARGGFGRIHKALAEDGSSVVVKLIPKSPGASRELLFEPISNLPNIIPIIDSGEWQEYYVLVMPRAEKSLRQYLGESGEKLPIYEVICILIDISEALASLQHDVVHRDLKPENILLYQGHWCLSDFGIARYAEATTAPDTQKYSFTRQYAAPEQWRHEHATPAADVYAFGIMAFELVQGHRPFPGPDYREQHLHSSLPPLVDCPPSIATLIMECLYKSPQARPTAANVLARLQASQLPPTPGAASLQAANQMIVDRQAQAGATASAEKSSEERRRDLFAVAGQSFNMIIEQLIERVRTAASAATFRWAPNLIMRLGDGMLAVDILRSATPNCLAAFGRRPAFDVIAYTSIAVRKPRDQYDYEGRSHSLWFCDAQIEGVYRWFETAFMVQPLIPERSTIDPFALPPTDNMAAGAFSPVISSRQLGWEPLAIDQGDEDQFTERWLIWFAEAVSGKLRHPHSMPENSGGHYRRA